MTQPVDDLEIYRNRAANQPKPDNWVEPENPHVHSLSVANFLATSGACYYSDTSEYQPLYNSKYPYPMAAFRFYSGYRLDNHVVGNWNYHKAAIKSGRTRVAMAYAVFIPGQLNSMMVSLKQVFGATPPTDRLALMLDMESGAGFAGPGNHSAEANDWAAHMASYLGTWHRVIPYANQPDYNGCWPQLDARLKDRRCVARYDDSAPSGAWAWQYYGALPFSTPAGAPRGVTPFGAYCDMNVIYKNITEIEADLGIKAPVIHPPAPKPPAPKPPEEDDMANPVAIFYVDPATVPEGQVMPGTWAYYQYSGQYIHVELHVGKTSNLDAIQAGAGDVGSNSITWDQHQTFLKAAGLI